MRSRASRGSICRRRSRSRRRPLTATGCARACICAAAASDSSARAPTTSATPAGTRQLLPATCDVLDRLDAGSGDRLASMRFASWSCRRTSTRVERVVHRDAPRPVEGAALGRALGAATACRFDRPHDQSRLNAAGERVIAGDPPLDDLLAIDGQRCPGAGTCSRSFRGTAICSGHVVAHVDARIARRGAAWSISTRAPDSFPCRPPWLAAPP